MDVIIIFKYNFSSKPLDIGKNMNFIDEAKIFLKAGDGGDGAVSFRREKYISRGGPDGGNGGKGGDIILKSNAQINTLLNFKYKIHFKANNGTNGKGAKKNGRSGLNILLQVPVGTQILSADNSFSIYDFIEDKREFKLIEGGRGGLGNTHFKSASNRSPRISTKGEFGKEMWINLKLKFLSDVGLLGKPNSGKSTFFSILTSAKAKIASYPFSTINPQLGIAYQNNQEFIVADLPGLIEGSSQGHGLGDRFLKHIERCKILIHIISATSKDIIKDYQNIRKELDNYSLSSFLNKKNQTIIDNNCKINNINNKPEIVCLSKCDLLPENTIRKKITYFTKIVQKKIIPISSYDNSWINLIANNILNILNSSIF